MKTQRVNTLALAQQIRNEQPKPPATPPRSQEIPTNIARLFDAANSLNERINDLASRLNPVCSMPAPANPPIDTGKPESFTDLGRQLRSLEETLSASLDTVTDLHRRLEL
jgi:hypothetical protein